MSSPFAHFFRRWGFNSDLRSYARARSPPPGRPNSTHMNTVRMNTETNACLKHPLAMTRPETGDAGDAREPERDDTGHHAQPGRSHYHTHLHHSTTRPRAASSDHYHNRDTTCTRLTLRDCQHYHARPRKTF